MIFDVELARFLSVDMCIDVNALEVALSEQKIKKHSQALFKAVGDFRKALGEEDAESEILKIYQDCKIPLKLGEARIILDSLRHAFTVFACGGLLDLYKLQENQEWYPKIVICREILPNDKDTLDAMVTIYRGCSTLEFLNGHYGQAWTTSLEVANLFAYSHYSQESSFNAKDRLVMKAVIPKHAIYYSLQHVEHEVVVNVSELLSIELYAP